MPSSYYTTEGIILKKTLFGECDYLVCALSRHFGKIDVIAKGVRKSGSKLGFHLDFLNHIRISFVKNGDRMPTLTDADIITRFDHWFFADRDILLARRMTETIGFIIHTNYADPDFFSWTLSCFRRNPEEMTIVFLKELFAREGYGENPNLAFLPSELTEGIVKLWPALMN